MHNKIIPYNPNLKILARQLRKQGPQSEKMLWNILKRSALGFEFHRQVPMLDYIVDFYCHELMLVIEIDGRSHDLQLEQDVIRQQRIEEYGVIFLRLSDVEVRENIDDMRRAIEMKIEQIQSGVE